MDNSRGVGQWQDWSEAEEKFRQTLLRLKREDASNQVIADEVAKSPYILGLVWCVTKKDFLAKKVGYCGKKRKKVAAGGAGSDKGCPRVLRAKKRGSQSKTEKKATGGAKSDRGSPRVPPLPNGWENQLGQGGGRRDDWRSETVCELLKSCRRGGMFGCDPERPNVGPYWRKLIEFKAVKAAYTLCRQEWKWYQPAEDVQVLSGDEAVAQQPDDEDGLMDLRLDILMLVDGLKDPRQRAVMRLSAVEGYNYPEIAAKLGLTFEQVRYAVEKAREVLTPQIMGWYR